MNSTIPIYIPEQMDEEKWSKLQSCILGCQSLHADAAELALLETILLLKQGETPNKANLCL